jgi:dihydrolipoamide dehydrogenase
MSTTEIRVPDLGNFKDVPVIDVLVAPGDIVKKEDPLITLESDKATMDVPSPAAGTVKNIAVKKGDKVNEGSLILVLEALSESQPSAPSSRRSAEKSAEPVAGPADKHAEVLVLGAGPGGYTAAFRAADLGKKVILVERYPTLGGVCLNVGCIPSKALLHAARVISETREMAAHGVSFGSPRIELDKLRGWKDSVVKKLTAGLAGLAKQRKVEVIQGRGEFIGPNALRVDTPNGEMNLSFDQAIIAAGSSPVRLPFLPENHPRVLDSTGALELKEVPGRLLVIGGGIIGLEMATVYHELGARVTVVELTPSLLPGVDADLVRPLAKRVGAMYEKVLVNTRIAAVEPHGTGLKVRFEGENAPGPEVFDYVLAATGRRPNGLGIGADAAGVTVNERGFIPVDRQQRTNVPHIFAIGDIVGQPMLAHKAVHEGKVAAEVCAGHKSAMDARCIPAVAYTDPEVAWVGVTETEAKEKGLAYGKGVFPWAASGRALGLGRDEGMTKLLFDEATGRVIGAGMVGVNAGDLVSEAALAIEMGCHAEDIGLTVHPHPTLSETVAFAAEMFSGSITDLLPPRKR